MDWKIPLQRLCRVWRVHSISSRGKRTRVCEKKWEGKRMIEFVTRTASGSRLLRSTSEIFNVGRIVPSFSSVQFSLIWYRIVFFPGKKCHCEKPGVWKASENVCSSGCWTQDDRLNPEVFDFFFGCTCFLLFFLFCSKIWHSTHCPCTHYLQINF